MERLHSSRPNAVCVNAMLEKRLSSWTYKCSHVATDVDGRKGKETKMQRVAISGPYKFSTPTPNISCYIITWQVLGGLR